MKYKLADVLKNKTQGVNTTTDKIKYVDNGYKIVQAKNIEEYNVTFDENNYIDEETFNRVKENHKLHKGDVLYTNIGSQLGNSALYNSDEKAIITWNVMKLIPNEKLISSEFLCYLLNYNKLKIKTLNSSSTMPFVSGKELMNFEIYIPALEIQNKITKILNMIQSKIRLNNQINDNLLKLNNQLYEEYFINNVDENANVVYLKNLIKVVNGYSYKGNELVDESDIGLATIKNFERKDGFKEDGFKPLNPQKIKEEQIAEKNDILVACTDLTQQADIIGNAVLLLGKAEYKKIIISMDLVKIIPKENIDKYVVFSILNSREFKNFALGYKSGTTVLHLNKKCFDDFIIKLPNNDKLDRFREMIKTNYEKISNILEENRRLEKLRDTLLPKLMNGEIDLDKIEV